MPATSPPVSAMAKTSAANASPARRSPAGAPEGAGRRTWCATQNIAAWMRSAKPRCAVSRNWLTCGSSTSPLFTMYQPMAPCSPPSTKMPPSFAASGPSSRPRAQNQRNGTR